MSLDTNIYLFSSPLPFNTHHVCTISSGTRPCLFSMQVSRILSTCGITLSSVTIYRRRKMVSMTCYRLASLLIAVPDSVATGCVLHAASVCVLSAPRIVNTSTALGPRRTKFSREESLRLKAESLRSQLNRPR